MRRILKAGLLAGFASLIPMCVSAGSITFDLNCVLSGSGCTPFPQSLGKVVVTDRLTNDGVDVMVTTSTGGKYIDLYFNVDVTPLTITSPSIYANDGFSLAPYSGAFDVGVRLAPSKGFGGDSGELFTILGTGFQAANFNTFDSLGLVKLGIHLQEVDCSTTTCVDGTSSIKLGGTYVPNPPPGDESGVPEPATMAIVGGGLMGVYWLRRRAD